MNLPFDPKQGHRAGPNWSRINQWLLWIGLAAAVAWMFFRHNAHLLQLLPFLFILACPLMHIFGHGGHGGHGDTTPRNPEEPAARPEHNSNPQPPAGGHAGHQH
ncbi:Protein of unknown function [Variovorax sp. HW608]|uniref:DUF2933 domain-containing protein n=1 Tax=Variovorax sp. HW608 TaxID=1034889 RepID=UPI00081FA7DE|nr:DUF2933 domain-containing protein [Variovorax sp. HW608]SCK20466.1 Protein of unknown function [Variovorax sp. HW608]